MSSYVDQNLMSGEIVLYRANVSLWALAPLIALGILLLPVVGIGLIALIRAWIIYRSTEFAVTDKRLIAKTGMISRSEGVKPGTSAFVESTRKRSTPLSPSAAKALRSVMRPSKGSWSILKSPVCRTLPAEV